MIPSTASIQVIGARHGLKKEAEMADNDPQNGIVENQRKSTKAIWRNNKLSADRWSRCFPRKFPRLCCRNGERKKEHFHKHALDYSPGGAWAVNLVLFDK